jgi:predicted thioesterase
MVDVKPGSAAEVSMIVEETHTARHLRSGAVNVLATPIMIALMEEAARKAVDDLLGPEHLSVGTGLAVSHQAATPVGMRVTARAELLRVEGRFLTFRVEANDEREMVGEGTHTRTIVNRERFLSRVDMKAAGGS